MRGTYLVIFVETFEVTSLHELSYTLCAKSDAIIKIADPDYTVCRHELVAQNRGRATLTMIINSTISLKPEAVMDSSIVLVSFLIVRKPSS